jgi:hypothetical protein
MATYYQVNVLTASGQFIDVIEEPDTISLARKVNNVGVFSLNVPEKFWKYAGRDMQFEFLRTIEGGGTTLVEGETRWFARRFERKGVGYPFLASGFDALHLVKRLIVAFPVNSAQAAKSGFADNIIKAIGTENLVYNGAATPPRGFKSLQIQGNTGLGATLPTKSFSRRVLLDIFQELALASWQAGTYLAFDIVLNGSVLELQTFATCRGTDRREGFSSKPLILSEDDGTLTDIKRIDDYSDEATVIYAGGSGTETTRLIGFDYDSDRIATTENNLNYIEGWMDARNTSDQTSLDSEASAELPARKPRRTLEGTLQDTPQTRYGVHYKLGDLATAKYDTEAFPVRIDTVAINYSARSETIITKLQGEI